ncbi:MAG: NHL repeat-containing protein [Gammaproteobacteria bacterium]|nr:NHL repeat-containing protein [Gammaproteobacteria bacterium]
MKQFANTTEMIRRLKFIFVALFFVSTAQAQQLNFELIANSGETYSQPHDIVLSPDGSLLFIADNGNHRIVVLDAQTLKQINVFGDGEVSEPHDVVFDDQGRLLVADTGNSRIAIYEMNGTSGKLVDSLSGSIRRPEGVAVHTDGRVFATGAGSGNLVIYQDGEEIAQLDGFSSPHDVEFDLAGNIWIADANNNRMVKLNKSLEITSTLAGAPYDFNGPRYIDFDQQGRMYVADKYTHSIKIIAADGTLIQVLGGPDSGKGEGVFDRPEGVEINGDLIWFSDTYNDRIVLYRMSMVD